MWTCVKCGEDVESAFEVCWSCGTTSDGIVDPTFVTADEAGPIDDPRKLASSRAGVGTLAADDALAGDVIAPPQVELVECYWPRDAFEARFLADWLIERGVFAIADGDALGSGLSGASIGHPYFSPRVRVRADDLGRARALLGRYERRRRPYP